MVLILASSKGATIPSWYVPGIRYRFNPRSRKGNDGRSSWMRSSLCGFNPRSRKGNDWIQKLIYPETLSFNPRSRKGNDIEKAISISILTVSIHVPARGTTAIIYKFPLYFLLLSMQLYQYNPGNASPADHTHLTLSQYYGANLPDTLCPLLFRTNPVLYCCFI